MNFRQRFRKRFCLSRVSEHTHEASTILAVSEVAFSLRQPLPAFFLGIAVFLAMFVPFLILAYLFGATVFDFSGLISDLGQEQTPHLFVWAPSWTAFTMSALVGAVLGLHRFGMLRYRETESFFHGLFEEDKLIYGKLISVSEKQQQRLDLATWFGLVIGGLVCWFLVIQPAKGWEDLVFTPRLWFVGAILILIPLLARTVALSAIEHVNLRFAFRSVRFANMFAYKPLMIFVRIALRRLLCWMVLISISALFLVGGEDVNAIDIPWIAVATFMAVWLFVSTIGVGRDLMNRHKDEAIQNIQQRISLQESRIETQGPDAAVLLLAYIEMERRIERLAESNLEVPLALRALGYVALPLLAWLSASLIDAAVVNLIIE